MPLTSLGKYTVKIKAATPISLPGLPYGSLGYTPAHSPYACLFGGGTYLTPIASFNSVTSPPSIVGRGQVMQTINELIYPTSPISGLGENAVGVSDYNTTPSSLSYMFPLCYLPLPISPQKPPSQFFNPGQGIGAGAPSKMVGCGLQPNGATYGIATNVYLNRFYSVNNDGANLLPYEPTLNFSIDNIAVNGTTLLAFTGSSYGGIVFYRGNLEGALSTFTFGDATLDNSIPNGVFAQGFGFHIPLQDQSGLTHYVMLNSTLTEYVEYVPDISEVPSGLANGVGVNMAQSLDGMVYYSDDAQGIKESGGNYTWTPLYVDFMLPFPPPYDTALIQRTSLRIACCPTGDGHR